MRMRLICFMTRIVDAIRDCSERMNLTLPVFLTDFSRFSRSSEELLKKTSSVERALASFAC